MYDDSVCIPPTETLEGKEHARCFFLDLQSKLPCARQGIREEVNIETILVCFLIMPFLCVVLLEGRRDIRLEKKTCKEENTRTQKAQEGRREKKNRQIDKAI